MVTVEMFGFYVSLISLGIALLLFLWMLITRKPVREGPGAVYSPTATRHLSAPGALATITAIVGLVFLTVSLMARAITTGHGPFTNMYEFAIAFAWGTVLMGLYFGWRYRAQVITAVGVVVAFALLLFASRLPSEAAPLVPALQQRFLLSVHVACAIIAYGSLTIGFGASILYILRKRYDLISLPSEDILDDMSYRTVLIGFPFLTLTIVLGAIWADIAWGRYWSWNPKETASLVTWLVYAGYLHARVLRGWRGSKSALLLIIGFAAILFTFFGNYIFSGLHSYG